MALDQGFPRLSDRTAGEELHGGEGDDVYPNQDYDSNSAYAKPCRWGEAEVEEQDSDFGKSGLPRVKQNGSICKLLIVSISKRAVADIVLLDVITYPGI